MLLRRAEPEDAAAIGSVFVRARDEMTYLPRIEDEHRPLLGGWFLERNDEAWVAEQDGTVVGFITLKADVLEGIYVDPAHQGRGVGKALLEHAKARRPAGLRLWVFQKNEGARRLYERDGFALVRLTDGSENMEREPDALYAWKPPS